MKIIDLNKKRNNDFSKWLKEVIKENFKEDEIINSALFIWELPSTKEGYQATSVRFNCDLDQMKYFYRALGERIKELEMDKFLKENLHKYIEFIED